MILFWKWFILVLFLCIVFIILCETAPEYEEQKDGTWKRIKKKRD